MEKPAGWWAGRSSGCCIMLERSIIMSMVRWSSSVDHSCQTSLPSGQKTKPKWNINGASIVYLKVAQLDSFTKCGCEQACILALCLSSKKWNIELGNKPCWDDTQTHRHLFLVFSHRFSWQEQRSAQQKPHWGELPSSRGCRLLKPEFKNKKKRPACGCVLWTGFFSGHVPVWQPDHRAVLLQGGSGRPETPRDGEPSNLTPVLNSSLEPSSCGVSLVKKKKCLSGFWTCHTWSSGSNPV